MTTAWKSSHHQSFRMTVCNRFRWSETTEKMKLLHFKQHVHLLCHLPVVLAESSRFLLPRHPCGPRLTNRSPSKAVTTHTHTHLIGLPWRSPVSLTVSNYSPPFVQVCGSPAACWAVREQIKILRESQSDSHTLLLSSLHLLLILLSRSFFLCHIAWFLDFTAEATFAWFISWQNKKQKPGHWF